MEGFALCARLRGKRSRLGQARTPQIAAGNLRPAVRIPTCSELKKKTEQMLCLFLWLKRMVLSKTFEPQDEAQVEQDTQEIRALLDESEERPEGDGLSKD